VLDGVIVMLEVLLGVIESVEFDPQATDAVAEPATATLTPYPAFATDVTTKVEPGCILTVKLLALTAMDCTSDDEPKTFNVYPPTFITALVPRVTSLYAAKAGATSPKLNASPTAGARNQEVFFIGIMLN
jgi:hypothetical protein